jgi:hypothetical protein
MRFISLTAPNRDAIYVSTEQVMMVRPPIVGADSPHANANIFLVNGQYPVHETVEEVMKLLNAPV